MKVNDSEMEKRIKNLTDDELVEMIENKSDQYVKSAIDIALKVAEDRGGIDNIKDELHRKKNNEESEKFPKQEKGMKADRLTAQERIKKKPNGERQQLIDFTSNYKSSYETTRLIAQIVSSVG